jgi:hypothetical protein
MEQFYNYITEPSSIVSFIIFVFWLWVTRSNLNGRIKKVEEKTDRIDSAKIESRLAEIQTDLAWIKNELNKMDK